MEGVTCAAMARKRGRPSKTPSSSSKKSPGVEKDPVASTSVEFSLSDEEALEDIDSLTPKKAAELLQSIDLLRQKVQSKIPADQYSDINKGVESNKHQEINKGVESNKHQEIHTETVEKSTEKIEHAIHSVWANFDISKLRNAGEKLNFLEPVLKEGQAITKIALEDVEAELTYWQNAIVCYVLGDRGRTRYK